MKKAMFSMVIAVLSIVLFVAAGCGDDSTKPKPVVPRTITLLSPKGGPGDSTRVGDTVTIRWTLHNDNPDSAKFGSLGITGSTDGGVNFIGIVTLSVPTDTPVWTSSFRWPIDGGRNSNQFVLKLYEYQNNSPSFDQSAPFVILP
jgi:hypothetical protein